MSVTAKLFMNGSSQAVDLPDEFRFQQSEVYIRRDPLTGDVVLSASEPRWEDYFDLIRGLAPDQDFLRDREQGAPESRPRF